MSVARAQIVYEPFGYATGNLVGNATWTAHSGAGSNPVQIVAGSVTYPNLSAPTGNSVSIIGGSGSREDVGMDFTNTLADGETLYASFALTVNSITGTDYFAHFASSDINNFLYSGRVVASASGSGFVLGLRNQASGGQQLSSTVFPAGSTVFVVVGFSAIAGADNDSVSLWINPSLGGSTAPAPSLTVPFDGTNGELISPNRFALRQGSGAMDLLVDEIRIDKSWATVAPGSGPPADDPDISGLNTLNFGSINPSATLDLAVTVTNFGATQALNVTGSTFTGPDAAKFSIVGALPTGIAPGTSALVTVRFTPGSAGTYTATLELSSNDTSGDGLSVNLTGTAATLNFPRVMITEVATRATENEFIELYNPANAPVDISGYVISDEDNSNTEGASKFPAGTVLAASEVIVVAVNNSATEPTWLDTLPAGVRVFVEPGRDSSAWTAANGNTITALEDFPTASGGTNSNIALTASDGVVIFDASVTFTSSGPSPATAAIDGVNFISGDSSPSAPINSMGVGDTAATKVGTAEPADGFGFSRLSPIINVNSSVTFAEAAITPGVVSIGVVNSVLHWQLME